MGSPSITRSYNNDHPPLTFRELRHPLHEPLKEDGERVARPHVALLALRPVEHGRAQDRQPQRAQARVEDDQPGRRRAAGT